MHLPYIIINLNYNHSGRKDQWEAELDFEIDVHQFNQTIRPKSTEPKLDKFTLGVCRVENLRSTHKFQHLLVKGRVRSVKKFRNNIYTKKTVLNQNIVLL
ncbi:hypothetical protein J6590_075767 [Homalodisca vitripennis]|nr:hypothetical protein J6590_075767 [Homalodisca vitripennis]